MGAWSPVPHRQSHMAHRHGDARSRSLAEVNSRVRRKQVWDLPSTHGRSFISGRCVRMVHSFPSLLPSLESGSCHMPFLPLPYSSIRIDCEGLKQALFFIPSRFFRVFFYLQMLHEADLLMHRQKSTLLPMACFPFWSLDYGTISSCAALLSAVTS